MVELPLEFQKEQRELMVLLQFGESLQARELKGILTSKTLRMIRGDNQRASKEDIHRGEFILWLLHKLGKVSEDDIDIPAWVFEALDKDRNGFLNQKDLVSS